MGPKENGAHGGTPPLNPLARLAAVGTLSPKERDKNLPLPLQRDHCKTSSPSRLASLAPLDEEVLGGLILRCEGEARASKDEVAYYAMIPQAGEEARA